MKQNRKAAVPGSISLLVILGVLCLTMLALLSLNTALTRQRISQGTLDAISDHYAADLEGERIFARLRAGESVEGVTREGNVFRYSLPISQYQSLQITLEQTPSRWIVLQWQTSAQPETPEITLPLWRGQTKEGTP